MFDGASLTLDGIFAIDRLTTYQTNTAERFSTLGGFFPNLYKLATTQFLIISVCAMNGNVKCPTTCCLHKKILINCIPLRFCSLKVNNRKRPAIFKRSIADSCYAVGNGYTCKRMASPERTTAD